MLLILYAALAYDSAQIIFEAIRHGGESRHAIYEYMNKLEDFSGIVGNISFRNNHDAQTKIAIFVINNGRFEFVE